MKKNKELNKLSNEIGIEINRLFEVFYKSVNPAINFGNKTNRASAEFLIKKFGFERALKMAQEAVKVAGETYAPVITTPYQLKENLGKLAIYIKRQRGKGGVVEL